MKVFRRFAYAKLRCAILVLRRNYGIHETDGSVQIPPGAMLPRPFCYRRSVVYVAVSDISYIAESVASMLVCLLHNIDG